MDEEVPDRICSGRWLCEGFDPVYKGGGVVGGRHLCGLILMDNQDERNQRDSTGNGLIWNRCHVLLMTCIMKVVVISKMSS